MPARRGPARQSMDWPGVVLLICAGVVVVGCFGLPLGDAVVRVVMGLARAGVSREAAPGLGAGSARLFLSSLGWSVAIAGLSAVFAWMGAWTLWRCGRTARTALVTPLLVPSYLAFAGWGLLRAPNSWLGGWLERAAQQGWHEAPIVAGRLLAVFGLAVWAFPLGAIVVWSSMRATNPAVLDALRADGASRWSTATEMVRLFRADILRSAVLVALVMLGSAVPLHLAQVETLAIQVWFALDNLPRDQQWRAWVAAWPLVCVAVAAGWWLGGRAARFDPGDAGGSAIRRGGWRDVVPGGVAWGLGVLVPLGFFVANLGQVSALGRFWESNGGAIERSVVTATGVAAGTLLIGITTGWINSRARGRARWAGFSTRVMLIAGLMPGILIGSAVGLLVTRAGSPWLEDSLMPVIAAHVARFGFLGALAGCWAANASRRLTGDPAALDGADTLVGWARASLRPVLWVHLSAAGAAGILSLHEIEATVQVMPPGDCLARVVLGDLHYSRVADMSAAGVWLLVAGLAPVAAVFALGRAGRTGGSD